MGWISRSESPYLVSTEWDGVLGITICLSFDKICMRQQDMQI